MRYAILYAANSAAQFSKIKPHQQVNLTNIDGGLMIEAIGDHPGLILPEKRFDQPCILKIVITAPVKTVIQLFFLARAIAVYMRNEMSQNANVA